jgi:hypothetical protein
MLPQCLRPFVVISFVVISFVVIFGILIRGIILWVVWIKHIHDYVFNQKPLSLVETTIWSYILDYYARNVWRKVLIILIFSLKKKGSYCYKGVKNLFYF